MIKKILILGIVGVFFLILMVFRTLPVVGRSPYSNCEPVDLMGFMEVRE